MRSLSLIILLLLNLSASAEGIEAVYQSRDGLLWSKTLPKRYDNGESYWACYPSRSNDCNLAKNPDGGLKVVDGFYQVATETSAAASACAQMNARLPTAKEFRHLVSEFDHVQTMDGPSLTKKGIADFGKFFAGFQSERYWSSSVENDNGQVGMDFHGYSEYGTGVVTTTSRIFFLNVRCVVAAP